MERELQEFLDGVIDSLIKLEIVLFFHSNPGTIDTPQGISMRIYRNCDLTASALRDLGSAGVLDCVTLGAGTYQLYSLTQSKDVLSVIELLDQRYHSDRTAMLDIIRRFLPSKKASGTAEDGTVRSAQ